MNPADRMLWLARHNAPKNMRLVTDLELAVISNGLNAERKARLALQAELTQAATVLDDYWRTQPDLVNACDAAVFDARRFSRGMEAADNALAFAVELIQLCAHWDPSPVVAMDLASRAKSIEDARTIIAQVRASRREHVKPCTSPSHSHPSPAS